MAIVWNRVTKLSQVVAILVGLVIFGLGFWLGQYSTQGGDEEYGAPSTSTSLNPGTGSGAVINDVTFACDGGSTVRAIFHQYDVQLLLSDGRNITLPEAVSASGARYANADESIVFWNKGEGAFITEGSSTTFNNCTVMPNTKL